MADRFEDLRNFVAVAETGGVNAAAARLGIAKSAVSRRLAEFEQRLGLVLADRAGRRFALTSEGVELLADARRLLADLERLETRSTGASRRPPLRVVASRDLIELVVVAAAQLIPDADGREIQFEERTQDAGCLAFEIGKGGDGSDVRVVGSCARGVYAAAGVGTEISESKHIREVAAVSVTTAGPAEWVFDGEEQMPRIVARVPDLRTALAASAAGIGIVRAPSCVVEHGSFRDTLRRILDQRSADVYVLATRPRDPDELADALIDMVRRMLLVA